jgi:hypothetical protein
MKTKTITGIMALFLIVLCGAGQVGVANAESTGVTEIIGMLSGVSLMLGTDLMALICFPIDITLLAFSFTGIGTTVTDLIVNLMAPLMMLIPLMLFMVMDIFGLSGILSGYLNGMTSSIVWFTGKWTYLSRVLFIAQERAFGGF